MPARTSNVMSGCGCGTSPSMSLRLSIFPMAAEFLDFGCGDGAFANETLAAHYGSIDGYDLRRPQSNAPMLPPPDPI